MPKRLVVIPAEITGRTSCPVRARPFGRSVVIEAHNFHQQLEFHEAVNPAETLVQSLEQVRNLPSAKPRRSSPSGAAAPKSHVRRS
jgi:hypothetical protein